eukprot:jgi/Mesvir1/10423/Mv04933-RA.1
MVGMNHARTLMYKTVTTASGTCGLDDVNHLTAPIGTMVQFCFMLVNHGTQDAINVTAEDDMGTASKADDVTLAFPDTFLPAGASMVATLTMAMTGTASTFSNSAMVTYATFGSAGSLWVDTDTAVVYANFQRTKPNPNHHHQHFCHLQNLHH